MAKDGLQPWGPKQPAFVHMRVSFLLHLALLLHDVTMCARSNLSPIAAPPLVADALQPEDLHDGGRLVA
uniref:Secreted protein n=1 Tax=Triticum urartu TaxID=4572 RepID=A0A8R7QTK6_TRIUA